VKEIPKIEVEKSSAPIANQKPITKYNIQQTLNKTETEQNFSNKSTEINLENLPQNHFTETDIQMEWSAFLENIKNNDKVIYSAVQGFKLSKIGESTISVKYPSETAKAEFEKIQEDFFNHFRRKVNNHTISVEYLMDAGMKIEIITKRKIFDKMVEINPLLKELDDLMKFDFN
jgi:DNA polymerase-3 subunit gamma/tau